MSSNPQSRLVRVKMGNEKKSSSKAYKLRAKNDRKVENSKSLSREGHRAHGRMSGVLQKKATLEKEAAKATAISSARRPKKAAAVAKKAKKAESQKKLSATAAKAHLKSNASLAALPDKLDAIATAKKATTISSARGKKIAAAKAKSAAAKSGGMVEVNMANGTTYYRKKPSR